MTRRALETGAAAALVVLAGAIVYELALALRVIDVGSYPGAGAPGSGVVAVAFLLAALVGIGAVLARSRRAALVGVAVSLATLVHLFTDDPYYAPTRRRMSDGGVIPAGWVVFLAAWALGAGVWLWLRPRQGARAPVLVGLLLCLVTWPLEGAGH